MARQKKVDVVTVGGWLDGGHPGVEADRGRLSRGIYRARPMRAGPTPTFEHGPRSACATTCATP